MNTNYINAPLQRYFQLKCCSCAAGSWPWEPATERPAPHAPWHRGNYPSLFFNENKQTKTTEMRNMLHGTVVDFLSKTLDKKILPKCIEARETTMFMVIFIFIMMFRRGRRRTRCRPPPWRRSSWPTSSVHGGSNLRSCRWWEVEFEIAWDSQFGRCDDMW